MLRPERVPRRATAETRLLRDTTAQVQAPAQFPGPDPASEARRKKAPSTAEGAAAVEDLKTRHAAAAPIRAPRPSPAERRAPPRAGCTCPPPRAARPAPPQARPLEPPRPRASPCPASAPPLEPSAPPPARPSSRLAPPPAHSSSRLAPPCREPRLSRLAPPLAPRPRPLAPRPAPRAALPRPLCDALCTPDPGSARRASACRPAPMSRWDSGVAEASGRSSPPGRPPAVGVTAPLRSPRSSGPQPPSPDFQLLMLQPIKYWSIELRKRLKPGFSSVS